MQNQSTIPYKFKQKSCTTLLESTFLENSAYFELYLRFTNRAVLVGSYGKNRKGQMQAFFKMLGEGKNRLDNEITHIRITTPFTKTYLEENDGAFAGEPNKTIKRKDKYTIHDLIVIDIDDFNGDWSVFNRLKTVGAEPNYIIQNPKKTQSLQVGYVLKKPVFECEFFDYTAPEDDFRDGQAVIFNDVYYKLTTILGGDPCFVGHNAKNPFYPTTAGDLCWTENPPYDLYTLRENVNQLFKKDEVSLKAEELEDYLAQPPRKNERYKYAPHSRNQQLFDELRLYAYHHADTYVETGAFKEFVLFLTEKANTLNWQGLPKAEVKATIKSIAKFCFYARTNFKYTEINAKKRLEMNATKEFMIKEYGINHRYTAEDKAEIARRFEITVKTVEKYRTQIRKEHGADKAKSQRIREIEALRNTNPPTKWARIAEMMQLSEDNVKKIYKRGKREEI